MKSGMVAAEAVFEAIAGGREGGDEVSAYPEAFRASWAGEELRAARNVRPGFGGGSGGGTLHAGIDQILLRGRAPWTLRHGHADHERLRRAAEAKPIEYPRRTGS